MKSHYPIILLLLSLVLLAWMSCAPTPPSEEPAPNPTPVEEPEPAAQPDGLSSESVYVTEGVDGQVTTSTTPDPNNPATTTGGEPETGTIVTGGLPERWPEYIPILPGFTVVTGVDGLDDPSDPGIMVSIMGQVPLTEAAEFYAGLEGWEKDETTLSSAPAESGFMMTLIRGETEKLEIMGQKDAEDNSVVNMLYSTGRR